MSAVYVDTTALGRILLHEPDAEAVLRELAAFDERVASRLLRIELRRLAATAGRLDAVMTYDARLADGAREHGLAVLAPA